ncbi:MAG: UvrD-helicase domain-containing protein [Oscillospiraceae bacterium]|nr:UvrD-helicase domain-containing protein [Oscillospiraceae bacterium]
MSDFNERFAAARRVVIARDFAHMNPPQREAVLTTEGPLLLLAGAGSGKTTVLINRIANLLRYGRGSDTDEVSPAVTEDDLAFLESYPHDPTEEERLRARALCAVEPVRPWEVLAITFTNKAAGELKDRLEKMLGAHSRDVWASTFHSACVRILRRDIDKLGFSKDFTIYDTDDCKRVVKDLLKEMDLDEKQFPVREVLSIISNAKDAMELPPAFIARWEPSGDWRKVRIGKLYEKYVARLRDANALDFDDIILHTVWLLQKDEEVRAYYQSKFRYILVDEYQDTNHLQYLLTKLLAGGHKNICVVGDDDQSIYRFRGADIRNILDFEKDYTRPRTIRLEQNYRSTQNILDAANAVIRNNLGRKGKKLWTESGAGEKIIVKTVFNENDEANYVAGEILMAYRRGRAWRENAVLYRMNAQSNAMELAFKRNGIPYRVFGGMKFFDRAEVKDMLSYLALLNNTTDDLRLRRIINNPARGIGAASIDKVQAIAAEEGRSMFDIAREARSYPQLKTAAGKLEQFAQMIESLRRTADTMTLDALYDRVCEESGYVRALQEKGDMESRGRLENVQELKSSILAFIDGEPEDATLAGFLNEIALYTDLDSAEAGDECVTMMTMHSAKGLEFSAVYLIGMEEGIFPGNRAMGEAEEMEEERRLCYVAMTRARKNLTLTNARQRMLFGRTTPNLPSRFIKEIPEGNMEWISKPEPRAAREDFDDFDGGFGGSRFGGFGGTSRSTTEVRSVSAASRSAVSRGVSASAPKTAVSIPQLSKGDMIQHKAFGRGMVLAITPMGGDALLEVAFDEVGTKKLMLRSAGIHIQKL